MRSQRLSARLLVALFVSTDGDNWKDNDGWLETASPCKWLGVNCEDGHVTILFLEYNELSGSIPPELGQVTNLTWLDLSSNKLSGSIPPELGRLTNLTQLELGANYDLSGTIPSELGELTNLESLSISFTQLRGSILAGARSIDQPDTVLHVPQPA